MPTRRIIAMFLLAFAAAGQSGCGGPADVDPAAKADKGATPKADAAPAPAPSPAAKAGDSAAQDATASTPSAADATPVKAEGQEGAASPSKTATAVIAGGCFWCVEAVFEELDGVIEARSGYAGGKEETANYKAVVTGQTKHAEAVEITYDPAKISYEKLLSVHFATHDPTTLNRQGADVGPQYRSAIFYASPEEKKAAEAMIARLNDSGAFPRPIVTTLEPLTKFHMAETYHQNYVCDNPFQPYVQGVAMPKVEKVRKLFKDDLKKEKTK